MDKAPLVRVRKGLRDLLCKVHGLLPGKAVFAAQVLLQCYAVDQFHDDILQIVVMAYVEDRDYIRVREHSDSMGLGSKPAFELLVLHILVLQDLDGDKSVEAVVYGPVDPGHSALADQFKDPVSLRKDRAYVLVLFFGYFSYFRVIHKLFYLQTAAIVTLSLAPR